MSAETAASEAVQRLNTVNDSIATAAREAGRNPEDIQLIAVSKTFEAASIRPVLAASQRRFGENRVQEAQGKWPGLRADYPDIELHLIGPLQSNKAEDAVRLFDCIHTIDRPKIARAIARAMADQNRQLHLFVQVNTGEEPQKAGIMPADTTSFVKSCRSQHGLKIRGLMCIPPIDEEPSVHFAFLAKLAREAGVENLSMGMSSDYEAAIALGATHVRVGSAIFGER